jgi:hypothetical protein
MADPNIMTPLYQFVFEMVKPDKSSRLEGRVSHDVLEEHGNVEYVAVVYGADEKTLRQHDRHGRYAEEMYLVIRAGQGIDLGSDQAYRVGWGVRRSSIHK